MNTFTEQTKYDVFISYSHKDYVDEQKNVIPGNEVSFVFLSTANTNNSSYYWFRYKHQKKVLQQQ